jgi:septum formation protein
MRLPFPVVLASASPRRRELLSKVVKEFTIEVSDVDEDSLTVADPWETASSLASAKAMAVAKARIQRKEVGAIIVGGDTVVALESDNGYLQLSKPSDGEDAVRMLKQLSGRRHAVITALAVVSPYSSMLAKDTAWVTFRELNESEIRSYVATGEPMDKAGAYAIQGGAKKFVKKLEGEIETVIGLPTKILKKMLEHVVAKSHSVDSNS